MTLARGRVLRSPEGVVQEPMTRTRAEGRRIGSEELLAKERAREVMERAENAAREILRTAEQSASEIRARSRSEGLADAVASLAEAWLRLRKRELRAEELAVERTVLYARLLAERLIGRSLAEDPALVSELAAQVLNEAGGSQRIRIHVHPDDARALEAALTGFDPDRRVHAITQDPSLGRGDLVLETDSGTIDAALGPSLERLAARLLEALHP